MPLILLKFLRKIFRSLAKLEYYFIDKITLKNFLLKKKIILENYGLNANNLTLPKNLEPKKIQIVICFFYRERRLKILKNIIATLMKIKFNKKITVVINNTTKKNISKTKKFLGIFSNFLDFKIISVLPEPNLLPWYCFEILKKKYFEKNNSHFLYIEDDILLNNDSLNYWILSRNILKKFKLIPGFLRYELKKNHKYFIDQRGNINLNKAPKVYLKNSNINFFNPKFPYSGICMMDKNLMKELIFDKSVGIDYGFHHKIMRTMYPIKELANIIIGYINVPEGFYNRFLIPFDQNNNIPDYCLIEHLDKKYTKGKIQKNILI